MSNLENTESNLKCCFCGDTGFDLLGLKMHYVKNYCEQYDEICLESYVKPGFHEFSETKAKEKADQISQQYDVNNFELLLADAKAALSELCLRKNNFVINLSRIRVVEVLKILDGMGKSKWKVNVGGGDSSLLEVAMADLLYPKWGVVEVHASW